MLKAAEFERLMQSTCALLKQHGPLLEEDETQAQAQAEQLARLEGLLEHADPVNGTALVALRPPLVAAMLGQLSALVGRLRAAAEARPPRCQPALSVLIERHELLLSRRDEALTAMLRHKPRRDPWP